MKKPVYLFLFLFIFFVISGRKKSESSAPNVIIFGQFNNVKWSYHLNLEALNNLSLIVLPNPLLEIFLISIDLYLLFLIFLKVLYKFFAASFKSPFLDKK